MTERHLENLSYVEVQEYLSRGDILILPTGVLEPHGRHLPLGTDGHCALAFAETMAERLDGLIAPCLHYGVIDRLAGYPGSCSVSEATYEALLRETLGSLAGSGFRTMIVSNGHGPNQPIAERVARQLTREQRVYVIVVAWYALTAQIAEEMYGDKGGHGGIQETSLMMCAHPGLVREDLYDGDDFCLVTEGVSTFPLPSALVLMRPEDKPVFDKGRAEDFVERSREHVAATVEAAVRQYWDRSGT